MINMMYQNIKINMLPDEAVYKPKKKEQSSKAEGLENFMESNE